MKQLYKIISLTLLFACELHASKLPETSLSFWSMITGSRRAEFEREILMDKQRENKQREDKQRKATERKDKQRKDKQRKDKQRKATERKATERKEKIDLFTKVANLSPYQQQSIIQFMLGEHEPKYMPKTLRGLADLQKNNLGEKKFKKIHDRAEYMKQKDFDGAIKLLASNTVSKNKYKKFKQFACDNTIEPISRLMNYKLVKAMHNNNSTAFSRFSDEMRLYDAKLLDYQHTYSFDHCEKCEKREELIRDYFNARLSRDYPDSLDDILNEPRHPINLNDIFNKPTFRWKFPIFKEYINEILKMKYEEDKITQKKFETAILEKWNPTSYKDLSDDQLLSKFRWIHIGECPIREYKRCW